MTKCLALCILAVLLISGRAALADENFAGFSHIDQNGNQLPTSRQAADLWGPVQTEKASVANLAPVLLRFFNNGTVFGLPGTEVGDFWHRTELTGDWGGVRTDLARHGVFIDLYCTSTYQNVMSGGLKTGSAFVQNTQLSLNIDTGRAGLWPGGLFHFTVESRYGSSPDETFTVGSTGLQYTGLAFPGPFLDKDTYPIEYFLVQALTPQFSILLGKLSIVTIADQTLFGNSYKYYFANLNFNKNPIALSFYNTNTIAAAGVWTPTNWLTIAGGVFDPNTQANNFAAHAFDSVNLYTAWVFSYKIGDLPGQFSPQYNFTNKPKIDLEFPFGPLSLAQIPHAVGVLLGSPKTGNLPINREPTTWGTIENISQYLFVMDDPATIPQKLKSGQPLQGIGVFARFGYSPEEASAVTYHGSVALFAHGLFGGRNYDSFGAGFYYNVISSKLKDSIRLLTAGTATAYDEQGMEIFYDFALTPAIRLIPSYQHIWNPLAADVSKNETGADVFLARVTVAF
jgi:porin